MTVMDNRPFTDDMLDRLRDTHKPTHVYIVGRRDRDIPTTGKPFKDRKRSQYRAPKLTKSECAAEYWKSCVDLAFTARANPDHTQVLKEVETWRRFATNPPAF